jgi:hypothetical protein
MSDGVVNNCTDEVMCKQSFNQGIECNTAEITIL